MYKLGPICVIEFCKKTIVNMPEAMVLVVKVGLTVACFKCYHNGIISDLPVGESVWEIKVYSQG